jgi:hypothetical protein
MRLSIKNFIFFLFLYLVIVFVNNFAVDWGQHLLFEPQQPIGGSTSSSVKLPFLTVDLRCGLVVKNQKVLTRCRLGKIYYTGILANIALLASSSYIVFTKKLNLWSWVILFTFLSLVIIIGLTTIEIQKSVTP